MSGPFGSSQWMYASGDYEIENSVRFDDVRDTHLAMTPGADGNMKTFTISCWVKMCEDIAATQPIFSSYVDANNYTRLTFISQNRLSFMTLGGGNWTMVNKSTPLYRDFSGWMHVVCAVDTTQGTNTNRVKIYVNGTQIVTEENTWPDENADTFINDASGTHYVGRDDTTGVNMYMAELYQIDGTALTPSTFGETGDYGQWAPIEASGLTYGDEGFYLDFKSSGVGTAGVTTIGADRSGNTNHFTSSGTAASDQFPDTPTNNFATLNPQTTNGTVVHAEGNLKLTGASNHSSVIASFGQTTGKWYFEMMRHTHKDWDVGITSNDDVIDTNENDTAGAWSFYGYSGNKREDGGSGASYDSAVASDGDVVMVAYDLDNQKIYYGKNGTWLQSGDPAAGSNPASTNLVVGDTYYPFIHTGNDGAVITVTNFGQDSSFAGSKTAQNNGDYDFYYAPPSGFKALCTKNLGVPIIPSEHYNTVTYTGNGSDSKAIAVGFQPDFVWIKNRDASDAFQMFDAVRGVTNAIHSDSTAQEAANADTLSAFTSTGFTIDDDDVVNTNTEDYVSWNWLAGGGSGSSNTDGSINTTSTSANVDAGFSISTYTGNATEGATIGHGLSKAPDIIWVKERGAVSGWMCYHSSNTSAPETEELNLEVNEATQDVATIWNDTAPTATVFSLGNNAAVNGNTNTFVAYCWHGVEGYSKFGVYTGNGSTSDGPFIYTGFRPAWLMVKSTSFVDAWIVFDTKRNVTGVYTNPLDDTLAPAITNAESVGDSNIKMDFYCNGFKPRQNNDAINKSGGTLVYHAFAETPFKYANAL